MFNLKVVDSRSTGTLGCGALDIERLKKLT